MSPREKGTISGTHGSERTERATSIAFLVALAAVAARFAILANTRATHEDFLITLRYAENLAAGNGFVYNPGERALGTTTPLYTLLLAFGVHLGLDGATLGKALNILADGGVCFLLVVLGRTLQRPACGILAALLYAFTSAPVNFSTGGMETGLVTLLGLSALLAYLHEREEALGILLGLLVFARIDGMALSVILLCAWAARGRRPPWRALSLMLLVLAPWLLFAGIYFGSPVPDSMVSKLHVYRHLRTAHLPNLAEFQRQFAGGLAQISLLVFSVIGLAASWRSHRALRPAWVWMGAYYFVLLTSKVPAFGWYFVPPLPVYYLTSALGAAAALRVLRIPVSPSLQRAALVALALLLAARLPAIARDIRSAQQLEENVRVPIGKWLRERMAPGETVMLEPIGTIGYYSRGRVLDVIGLVSPQVRAFYQPGVRSPLRGIALRYRPEWMVLRPNELAEVMDTATTEGRRLFSLYQRVAAFPPAPQEPIMIVLRRTSDTRDSQENLP